MILRLKYEFKNHPYADEISSQYDKWAQIKVLVVDENGQLLRVVFDIQWNIKPFLDWVIENKEPMLNEEVPLMRQGKTSLAKLIFDFYENLESNSADEKMIDMIYSYRERHGIRFALRGTDIDDIYIGLVDNLVTISFYGDENNQWDFDILFDDFLKDVQNACLEAFDNLA